MNAWLNSPGLTLTVCQPLDDHQHSGLLQEATKMLSSAGAKTDFLDTEGQTAVSTARQNGHKNLVRILLDSEAAQQPEAACIWLKVWRSLLSLFTTVITLLGLVGTVIALLGHAEAYPG